MSQYKKIAVIFIIVSAVSVAAVYYSLKELYKCINDINSANEEKAEIAGNDREKHVLGKEIKDVDFLNAETYYNVAKNGKCLYFYCKNQYLEVSSDTNAVLYFCYDRPIGAPACGASECEKIATSAVSECLAGIIKIPPHVTNTAFDGRQYVYNVSLGEYGSAIVRIAADSGKVTLFDGRNVNIF